ncbi:hypothetical protein ROZALSC1DRAFT_25379, partial [Rozella allomycis CSF55]
MERIKRTLKAIFDDDEIPVLNYVMDLDSILVEPMQVKSKILSYYKNNIYAAQNNHLPNLQRLPQEWQDIHTTPPIPQGSIQKLMQCITTEELLNALSNAPTNKAPGPSGITFELLRLLPLPILTIITQCFNNIIKFGTIPTSLQEMNLIILPKDKTWKGDITRTRPIAILECIKKLLSSVITNRLNKYIFENNLLR